MEGDLKNIRVDASAEGCSGMYWRTKCVMSASTPSSGAGKYVLAPAQDNARRAAPQHSTHTLTPHKQNPNRRGDDWPRNGTILKGRWLTVGEERWVQFENGLYLPEKQAGFTILFEVA
jgi:hypothetical protein